MVRSLLHRHFGLEAFDVAEYRSDVKHAPIALEAQEAVPRRDIALDRKLVPFLGMADIVDLKPGQIASFMCAVTLSLVTEQAGFSAEQIVVLLRQIEVAMGQGKWTQTA